MKSVLLYYSFSFALGGGEYLPLAFIAALQKVCKLTVAVDMACNFERSCKAFGEALDIDRSKFKIVEVTPPGYDPKRHNVFISFYRFRQLKRLAKSSDVCISTASIMDFGAPSHQFINMIAFGDDDFTNFAHNNASSFNGGVVARAKRLFSDSILRPILGMRSKRKIICDRRQHIYPNSRYVEKLMTDFYGPINSTIFYPPTLFKAEPASNVRDSLKVVYIGRIVPDKRIEDMVAIVEMARAITGVDVAFHVAGRLNQTPSYGKKLEAMAKERPWLKFVGALYGAEKAQFLTSGTYAIHAERDEAFGISVAEYLVSGLIPIVPDEGGTPEIVASPALSYHTNDDAAKILAHLLSDAAFREERRRHCANCAKRFSREAYFERQSQLLADILA